MIKQSFLREWISPIIWALIISVLINRFIFFNVYVPTGSMIPTINLDDKLLITRIYNVDNIKRGDIIVFYSEELESRLIKRAIGLPGDHVEIKDGVVKVNENILEEEYVKNNDDYNGEFDVPEGKFLFLGDNRTDSKDARLWINPYIDESSIQGKARFILYPFNHINIF